MKYNALFLEAYLKIIKSFNNSELSWYPASIGPSYKELFSRDAFACIAVNFPFTPEIHYIFFNASYDKTVRRMLFTSISIVSIETFLLKKKGDYLYKQHVENSADIDNFLNKIESLCDTIK